MFERSVLEPRTNAVVRVIAASAVGDGALGGVGGDGAVIVVVGGVKAIGAGAIVVGGAIRI